MIKLSKIFFQDQPLFAWLGGLTILLLTLGGVWLSFEFLDWYGKFYNALEIKDYEAFKKHLISFSWLAGLMVIQIAVVRFINQHYTFAWRVSLTNYFLDKWHEQKVEGAAQRIQEDCAKFARLFETIFIGCFNAVVSLVVFTPTLMSLSEKVFPNYWGLLWFICLGYTIAGLTCSFFLGRKLPKLEYNNQVVEAKFRTSLEYKKGNYKKLLDNIKSNYIILFSKYKIFNLFSSSFFQFGVIIPYLLVGKYYFLGVITLGALVQVGKSFNKVNDSMAYLIDSWLSITELQSVILRLTEFDKKL